MDLLLNNEQSEYDAEQFRDFIVQAFVELLAAEGVDPDVEVSLTFVDDEQIRELNRSYRGKDQPLMCCRFSSDGSHQFLGCPGC